MFGFSSVGIVTAADGAGVGKDDVKEDNGKGKGADKDKRAASLFDRLG
jgi:hypothetical protein